MKAPLFLFAIAVGARIVTREDNFAALKIVAAGRNAPPRIVENPAIKVSGTIDVRNRQYDTIQFHTICDRHPRGIAANKTRWRSQGLHSFRAGRLALSAFPLQFVSPCGGELNTGRVEGIKQDFFMIGRFIPY